jgi:hypothetical protein
MNFFKKLFGKKEPKEISEEDFSRYYDLKSKGLEDILGQMHGMVGHAMISFAAGGAVDMYYYPNHIPGTGFATKELLEPDGTGPLPNRLGTYELVAFTKYPIENTNELEVTGKEKAPFNLIERQICGIFTTMGFYSKQEVLNPKETCEIPMDGEENICLIFDLYNPGGKEFCIGNRKHHLLLCMQVHRAEMNFARENGTIVLIQKLKQAGYYPYSDLDRKSVV